VVAGNGYKALGLIANYTSNTQSQYNR